MSSPRSSPGGAAKSMSSRLLTMKFMQRAAASSSTSSPNPISGEPGAKRQKIIPSSPSKVNVDALADQSVVQAALAAEEAKRRAALEKQGAETGDTRWSLSFEDPRHSIASPVTVLRIVQTGYADLDSPMPTLSISTDDQSAFEDKPATVGRRSFGRFNRVLEKQQKTSSNQSSESDSDGDDSASSAADPDDVDSLDTTGAHALIKASRQEAAKRVKAEFKAKRHAEKAESLELAKKRKKKNVQLNGLTSLSGRKEPVKACFNCGGPHLQAQCDRPPRKTRKSK